MKKLLLLTTIVFLFFNCNTKEQPTEVQTPSSEEEKSDVEDEIQEFILTNFDGFTVGNGVRLRESADLKSKKVAELPHGLLVSILDQTRRKSLTKGSQCDEYGYPWLKIKTVAGHEGWIFGKFIYRFEAGDGNENMKKYAGKTFKFDDEPFEFGVAFDFSYPVGDDEGLTFCEDMALPFFYKPGDEKIQPIFARKTDGRDWELSSHKNGYWALVSSDGISEQLLGMLQILWGARATYFADHQEGTAEGEIDITRKNNKFYAKYTKYNRKLN